MKPSLAVFILSILLVVCPLEAQPRVISTEELPLGTGRTWQNPRFSPSGRSVFYTSSNFHGIWEFSLDSRTIRQITADPSSGYGYTISHDGKTLAYRTTILLPTRHRKQQIVLRNLVDADRKVVDSGEDISTPAFAGGKLFYSKSGQMRDVSVDSSTGNIEILGIENTKIVLLKGLEKVFLDPFGFGGSYVWPSLSPDKKTILAYEMKHGTFIAHLDGTVISILGRRDSPSWTHDGKWIAYMDEKDDGYRILTSDILLVSPDGAETHRLTTTQDSIELDPHCSPAQKEIVYHTLDGKVFILTYTE
ncbi:MAG: WD40-like Beta Propeller Repeat [Bacteroidetes bacterium]|nr:WD40-like Beta Propeller Repeat [Bacteroidota bacterium]